VNARGFSLVEGLMALAILGVVMAAIIPTFTTYQDTNRRNEERTGAVAVAQQVLEAQRRLDPSFFPESGPAPAETVSLDGRDYEVIVSYCEVPEFCSLNSRHLMVEVSYDGRRLYSAESVFTKLR